MGYGVGGGGGRYGGYGRGYGYGRGLYGDGGGGGRGWFGDWAPWFGFGSVPAISYVISQSCNTNLDCESGVCTINGTCL